MLHYLIFGGHRLSATGLNLSASTSVRIFSLIVNFDHNLSNIFITEGLKILSNKLF